MGITRKNDGGTERWREGRREGERG